MPRSPNPTEQLALQFFDRGLVVRGDFKFRNGKATPFYLNFRSIVAYPELLHDLAARLSTLVADVEFEHVCGVPYAAMSFATLMSQQCGKSMVVKRKEKDAHGTMGKFAKGDRCLLVDDIINSGSSLIETAEALVRDDGLAIQDVVAIVDRQLGGAAELKKRGFRVHALFTPKKLLTIHNRYRT